MFSLMICEILFLMYFLFLFFLIPKTFIDLNKINIMKLTTILTITNKLTCIYLSNIFELPTVASLSDIISFTGSLYIFFKYIPLLPHFCFIFVSYIWFRQFFCHIIVKVEKYILLALYLALSCF